MVGQNRHEMEEPEGLLRARDEVAHLAPCRIYGGIRVGCFAWQEGRHKAGLDMGRADGALAEKNWTLLRGKSRPKSIEFHGTFILACSGTP